VEPDDVARWESSLPDRDAEEQDWSTAMETLEVVGEAVWKYHCNPLSQRLLPRLAELLEGYDQRHALAELERDFQLCGCQPPTPPESAQGHGETPVDANGDLLPAFLSAADLANHLGQPVDRVEPFLRRFRPKNKDCFTVTDSPKKNEPRYLYRTEN